MGTHVRPQWRAYAFGLLFAVVVALVVSRLGTRYGPSEVTATVRTYQVVSDTAVEITVRVRRDSDRDALCLLRSRNAQGAEVGHLDLRVPADPGGAGQLQASRTVPTTERGVTGEAGSCVALEPGEPAPFDAHALSLPGSAA